MKLLICTQVVDKNDSDLGFFHRWIEEFAKQCDQVTVICLFEGEHALPENVRVYSLGKNKKPVSKLQYALRFWKLLFKLRHDYDNVFVHMNPEYILLGGLWWRLCGKKIGLWYTHKSVDVKLRIATFFANIIFTASPASFRLPTKKLHVIGHGIGTDFFAPNPGAVRGDWALSVGRLSKSKRHDLAIRAASTAGVALRIAGEGPERHQLGRLAQELHASVDFLGGLTQTQLRDEYQKAAYLIHTSETGSLDKVVLEALACGLPIRTNDPALKALEEAGPDYVRDNHGLARCVATILSLY
jgi:glycosyltransferase involved in cell wall biosynthesis